MSSRAALVALVALGWGANQFAPLVVLYQSAEGVPAVVAQTMFVLYAVGLVPGLFLGGATSDRYGRRAVVLAAVLLSVVSSLVLMAGGSGQAWLGLGRLLAGVASGVGFGAGTAWVKESSDDARGPRRAVLAMTAGFAAGPLVAGLLAALAPAPTVWPCAPHVLVGLLAAVLVARTPAVPVPGTVGRTATAPGVAAPAPSGSVLADPRFRRCVLPLAPWVFLTASVALAVLPGAVRGAAHGHDVLFSALVTPLPALAGLAVQGPVARLRWTRCSPSVAGLGAAALGLATGAVAVAVGSLAGTVVACVVLGAAYGICQTAGLAQTVVLSAPARLGRDTAAYQALTYLGYLAPLPVALLAQEAGTAQVLGAFAVLAPATAWVVGYGRRTVTA